jgi:tRNA (guanine10-N2)-methyltransferase
LINILISVTDPPYGVRAGSRKLNMEHSEEVYKNKTQIYDTVSIFQDLVNFAADHLVLGGRLVFFMPTVTEE